MDHLTPAQRKKWDRYASGPEGCIEWIRDCVMIEDPQRKGETWFAFDLWPEQEDVIRKIFENQKVIAAKARQLGLTWVAIAVALWYMIFQPGSKIGLLSARDKEAVELLKGRLKGMYRHLPEWIRTPIGEVDNDHEWHLENGSTALAFPTGRGDSYTLTFAVVDEADIPDDLDDTLLALEPAIDAGGKILLISKLIKKKPKSRFKAIFRGAEGGKNGWFRIFLPWWVRRERTREWYEEQKRASIENTNSLDAVHENYPATEAEALSPPTFNKRIADEWLLKCHTPMPAISEESLLEYLARLNEGKDPDDPESGYFAFTVRGAILYRLPDPEALYVIGADPAEGNPTSDDSALSIMDRTTWEEVGVLAEKLEPEDFASTIDQLGRLFNHAAVMCERNNHGHAVLLWLKNNSKLHRFRSDDKKPGWLQTGKSKNLMYDAVALAFRQGDVEIHNLETYAQLASIEGDTLSAPQGEHDDRAVAFALALQAAKKPVPKFV